MTRALVIGGTRFIGAHVVRHLVAAGVTVTVFHRGQSQSPVLPPVEHVCHPDAAYPITRFPETLQRDWDVVVHMVAMGAKDAQAAVKFFKGRAGRLVIVSSSDVYLAYGRLTKTEPGVPDDVPLREDAPLRSVFYPYREMEEQLGTWARAYEKIHVEAAVRQTSEQDWTILRLPKVYGREDNGDLATVYGFESVPPWRWTHGHVDNVAAAIALAARHPDAGGQIFNVGEAFTPTMGERLRALPARSTSQADPPAFDYRQSLVLDTRRIRDHLGFQDVVDEQAAMQALAESAGR